VHARRLGALLALGLIIVSTSTGQAASGSSQDVAPFTYTFRVVDFSATATLTYASTAATIRYHLVKPSVPKTIAYLGSRPTNRGAAWKLPFAGPIVDVAAEATYRSPDSSCTSTIQYKPAGSKIVQVYVELAPRIAAKRVSASVSRLPLAEPHPGEDGTDEDFSTKPRPRCGKPDMGSWYQDMESFAPAALVGKPRVTLTGTHRERFTDPGIESIEWKLTVVLQRVAYRKIDCATHPGC
jgi:hypothetical protein